MYYKLYTQDKKIPIPVAVLAVCLVFIVPFFLVRSKKSQLTEKKAVIENIVATNVTNASISVYWQTQTNTEGIAYFSDDSKKIGERILDDRDIDSAITLRRHHLATIRNLRPDTTYYIRVDGNKTDGSALLEFTTLKKAQLSTNKPPLYGKVTNRKGEPVEGAIVFVKVKNASPLATITKNDGNFLLSICCLVHEVTQEKIAPANSDTVEMSVFDNSNETQILADISTISPLEKTIILGQDINLIAQRQKKTEAQMSESVLGQAIVPTFEKIDFFYPKNEAVIPGLKPLFKGSGIANQKITLFFSKSKKTVTFQTDGKGGWSYTPEFNLDPGQQNVKMETIDDKGKVVKRERIFSIAKSGESVVLGEATPEATLSPTVPAKGRPTAFLTEAPTLEPTLFATATPTPPITGVSFNTFSLFSIALIAVGAGLVLLF